MQLDATAIILSILSVISTLGLGLLQFRKTKSEAKEAETRAQVSLVEIALQISKQEIDTIRAINQNLVEDNKRKDEIIDEKDEVIRELRRELDDKKVKQ